MAVEVVIPALGLTVEKGTILRWIKREGDAVSKGESLYEVEADKVTTEVEAPASGVLKKILIPEGLEVPILTPVAVIADAKEVISEKYVCAAVVPLMEKSHAGVAEVRDPPVVVTTGPAEVKAPPAARRLARERGIDLSSIRGSGPGGVILLKDIESFAPGGSQPGPRVLATPAARKLAEREGIPLAAVAGTGISGRVMRADVTQAKTASGPAEIRTPPPEPKPFSKYRLGQIIPMNSMRKAIARRMAQSKFTAPHIYFFNDVEMDKLVSLREEVVAGFEKNGGARISINDLIIKAVALNLREHPLLNASVSGDEIRVFPEINVGLAVAMEDGLIVPAIPRADELAIGDIARLRADLVERGRQGKLTREEMERGTFTVSSLAQLDITFFTAILNPPQSGILTLGKMEERPVVREGQVVVRKMMRQGLSVDHRIVDGAMAARFLQNLKKKLENPYYAFLRCW